MLYASREDDTDLMSDIFTQEGSYDINHQDGLGKSVMVNSSRRVHSLHTLSDLYSTALHYSAASPSPDTLEMILEHDGTDVDRESSARQSASQARC